MTTELCSRKTAIDDLEAILALLADDELGRQREQIGPPSSPAHLQAFEAISADKNPFLTVAELSGDIVGASNSLLFLAYRAWACGADRLKACEYPADTLEVGSAESSLTGELKSAAAEAAVWFSLQQINPGQMR